MKSDSLMTILTEDPSYLHNCFPVSIFISVNDGKDDWTDQSTHNSAKATQRSIFECKGFVQVSNIMKQSKLKVNLLTSSNLFDYIMKSSVVDQYCQHILKVLKDSWTVQTLPANNNWATSICWWGQGNMVKSWGSGPWVVIVVSYVPP